MEVIEKVLQDLTAARSNARREFECAQLNLARIEQAIRSLTAQQISADFLPKRTDFEGLGIVEATERLLSESNGEATTPEIAKELLARGVRTKSARFVPTVFATLTNAKQFERIGEGRQAKWRLRCIE